MRTESTTTTAAAAPPAPCILIMEDWSSERPTAYRAYCADSPESPTVCPLVGYCSPGGSFPTIRDAARDARRRDPDRPIYRGYHSDQTPRLLKI